MSLQLRPLFKLSESRSKNVDTIETVSSDSENMGLQSEELVQKQMDEAARLEYQQLSERAWLIFDQYREKGELNDLQAALNIFQEGVELTQPGHPNRARWLRAFAVCLNGRYQRLGDLDDLQAAFAADQEAVDLTPQAHFERAIRLQGLGVSLGNRYQRLGNLNDLHASVKTFQEMMDLTPKDHPHQAYRLTDLAVSYTNRYNRLGDLKDLEAGLQAAQSAVDLTPQGHPELAGRLQVFAASCENRYQKLGDLKDLEAGLKADQEAVRLTPRGHPNRAHLLQGLAAASGNRYGRLGDLKDLDMAVKNFREAVDLTPKEHPQRAERLQGLSGCLGDRYRRLGHTNDLQSALKMDQEVLALTPPEHPQRASRLDTLSGSFSYRYRQLGDLKDFQAASDAAQEAVDITPHGHPAWAARVTVLASCFLDQYTRLGDLNDLQVAVKNLQEAVDITSQGHPTQAGRLHRLAGSLISRYYRLGDLNDLQAALKAEQEGVNLIPPGHPDRASHLQGLAASLRDRYRRLGDTNDLHAAFEADQEAVALTPHEHIDRPRRLDGLATSFRERYYTLGDMQDLEAALQAEKDAVDLTPEENPDRALLLHHLAFFFTIKYRKSRRSEDLEALNNHYNESFKIPTSFPDSSWRAALKWASAADEFKSSACLTAYSHAFHLLPELIWVGNILPVRHEAIQRLDIGKATSDAARTYLNFQDPASAVEIMEQGLGITFQQVLQLRTDLDGLLPEQAERLRFLSSELYSGKSLDPRGRAIERQGLLKVIRQQPGLEHFLLPKPYKALCYAAKGGPVVLLNSHHNGCDGIIIPNPTSNPVHVPLRKVALEELKLKQEELRKLLNNRNFRTREVSASSRLFGFCEEYGSKTCEEHLADLLAWLSQNVVSPVYKALALLGIYNGRLWWLPTGAFIGLPLHASSSTNQFIHSYTATLGSLLDSYARKSCTAPKLGIVGVTNTGDGSNYLPGVQQEVKKILSVVDKSYVQSLEGQEATVNAVKLQLTGCSWVHLACHGIQDPIQPAKSCLLLHNGNLELASILQMDLSSAEFVFLAACQTAMGDALMVNESFHLGGGFIAAGFRGAIGTLWSMNDGDGPVVAERIYSYLFREGRQPQTSDAAEALSLAIEKLKTQNVPLDRWILFIHMGV